MSIRIRLVDGVLIACCAARTVARSGDIYLDDAAHHALTEKFGADFASEGYPVPFSAEDAAARELQESNNSGRTWWDEQYAAREREDEI